MVSAECNLPSLITINVLYMLEEFLARKQNARISLVYQNCYQGKRVGTIQSNSYIFAIRVNIYNQSVLPRRCGVYILITQLLINLSLGAQLSTSLQTLHASTFILYTKLAFHISATLALACWPVRAPRAAVTLLNVFCVIPLHDGTSCGYYASKYNHTCSQWQQQLMPWVLVTDGCCQQCDAKKQLSG